MDNQQIRLNKFLAERLGISRREADDAIVRGAVTVDGKKAVLGDRILIPSPQNSQNIDKNQKVCYNNKTVPLITNYSYIAFNKPEGYVCSRKPQGDTPTIYELLPPEYYKLKTVGRLDKDSSGLILLTNDGDFAFQMTHPKFHKEKVYEVELNHSLAPLHQQMISDFGVTLEDGISKFTVITSPSNIEDGASQIIDGQGSTQKESTKKADRTIFTVILSEGRNRQIRRTFAALGYKVVKLHRIQFGKYQLSGLKPGKYVTIKP